MALSFAGLVVLPAAAHAAPGFDRHYELATPSDKASQPARVVALAPDGSSVSFDNVASGNGFPGTGSQTQASFNSYLASRAGRTWVYVPMNLAESAAPLSRYWDAAPSLLSSLFTGEIPGYTPDHTAVYARESGGQPRRVSPFLINLDGAVENGRPRYLGASRDLSHVVLDMVRPGVDELGRVNVGGRLLPSDPPWDYYGGGLGSALYETVSSDPPMLRRVDVGSDGLVARCGAFLGSNGRVSRAVSDDGQRIFFSISEECGGFETPVDIYARVGGTQTIQVSASECDRTADAGADPPVEACAPATATAQFESASVDGERVFFTTENQLVNNDTDAARDLYVYDFSAPVSSRLSRLSVGDGTAPTASADVQGFLRASDDGSRAYFVARGVLTANPSREGAQAVDGGNNLYVATRGASVAFVATLTDDSELMWGATDDGQYRPVQLADPAGRYLIFASATRLTEDDADTASDIYRFDATAGTLVRVSVGRNGFGDNGNSDAYGASFAGPNANRVSQASVTEQSRRVSRDGSRIVFATDQPLESGDVNERSDVYEWYDGQVRLVSDGQDPIGVGGYGQGFVISEDGGTVAFSTWRRLLPARDVDTMSDVYVARTGEDVDPLPPGAPPLCVEGACQDPFGPAPPFPVGPGTSLLTSAGNPVPPPSDVKQPRVRVAKGKPVRGTATRIAVKVPAKGRIWVTGVGLGRVTKTASKAGTYRLTVKLTPRSQLTLKRKGRVSVRGTVRFSPASGSPQVANTTLTFRSRSHGVSSRAAGQANVVAAVGREGR